MRQYFQETDSAIGLSPALPDARFQSLRTGDTRRAGPQLIFVQTSGSTIGDPDFQLETSTALSPQPEAIRQEIENVFICGKEEFFEDGMQSSFSLALASAILKYGPTAVNLVSRIILGNRENPELVSEALRRLGKIQQQSTYRDRLWLLERALLLPDARVRYGAALGLASMDNPTAIPLLRQAIQKEPIKQVQQVMAQVLSQLEATSNALPLKKNQSNQVA